MDSFLMIHVFQVGLALLIITSKGETKIRMFSSSKNLIDSQPGASKNMLALKSVLTLISTFHLMLQCLQAKPIKPPATSVCSPNTILYIHVNIIVYVQSRLSTFLFIPNVSIVTCDCVFIICTNYFLSYIYHTLQNPIYTS